MSKPERTAILTRTAERKVITLSRRAPVKPALLAAAALAGLVLWTGSAGAHADYERSEPGDGATVAESPQRVDAWFGQEMRRAQGLPTMIVVNASGDTLNPEDAVLDDADRTHMYVDLPPDLPDGRYTAIWHTLSDEDGEEAQGAFHFFVGAGGDEGTPAPSPRATLAPGVTPTPEPEPTFDDVIVRPSVTPTGPAPTPATAGDDKGGDDVPLWALALGVMGGAAAGSAFGVLFGLRRGR
jgi:methionine-rich copper-binding protein CopC